MGQMFHGLCVWGSSAAANPMPNTAPAVPHRPISWTQPILAEFCFQGPGMAAPSLRGICRKCPARATSSTMFDLKLGFYAKQVTHMAKFAGLES